MAITAILREVGITTLITGLAAAATGGVFLAIKPQTETKELPDAEISKVTTQNVACAPTSSLEGFVVAMELPGNGTWTGHSTADGAVRIDVQPTIPMPEGTKVQVVVQSSPSTFAASVVPGTVIGELTFEKPRPSSPLATTRKLSSR